MNINDMTFTEVADLFDHNHRQIENYKTEINRLNKKVAAFDLDETITALRSNIETLEQQLSDWKELADRLVHGIWETEEQLANENIGLRQTAQVAISRYMDLSK